MPQSRSRSQSSSPQSAARESLSAEEMEALAAFDLVENALDDFQTPAPVPELASRREIKAAKDAAKTAARISARNPAAPAPRPGAHYFASSKPLPEGQGKGVRVRAAGADLVLLAGAGTFSKSELDEGTEILLDSFAQSDTFAAEDATEAPKWCDLGCGWGAVACVLATQKPEARLWACDINRRAVALARSNARDLDKSIAAWNGDGLTACRSDFFDAILCNPPVRAGNRVIEGLFNDALRCLNDGGELWIVLRTAQGAKSWQKKLADLFGNCDTVQISHGYRILCARKNPA